MKLSEWWQRCTLNKHELLDLSEILDKGQLVIMEDISTNEIAVVGYIMDNDIPRRITRVEELHEFDFMKTSSFDTQLPSTIGSRLTKTFKPDLGYEDAKEEYSRRKNSTQSVFLKIENISEMVKSEDLDILVMDRQSFTDFFVGLLVDQYSCKESEIGNIEKIIFNKEYDPNKIYVPRFYSYVHNNPDLMKTMCGKLYSMSPSNFCFVSFVLMHGVSDDELTLEVIYEILAIKSYYDAMRSSHDKQVEDLALLEKIRLDYLEKIEYCAEALSFIGAEV
ncbi:MAG: hypothetical protein ACRC0G_07160 [Fusobacteriaceae bacterium]